MTIRPGESSTSRGERRRFTLDELFQDTSPRGEGVSDLEAAKEIRLDRIVPDPEQPRRTMDRARFEELVASVRQEGVLVPIEVSYNAPENIYVIVHGERRWRAAGEAGLATIPALVREVDGRQRIVHQLMENILREDLNAVDRARALRTLKGAMGGAAWELVADAVGIRRSRLFQLLDVIKLPDELQEDIRAGRLSEKHGRAFKDLPQPRQAELRDLVLEHKLSGDETVRVAQTLRRSPHEITAQDALTLTRTPPTPPAPALNRAAAAATQVVEDSSERAGIGGEEHDAPASTASAAEPALTERLLAEFARVAGLPAFADTLSVGASSLVAYQYAHSLMQQRLADLVSVQMHADELRQAIVLLEELQDLVDTTLDQLLRIEEVGA